MLTLRSAGPSVVTSRPAMKIWPEVGASSPGGRGKIPFPGRFRLNEALFVRGDREALKTMVERYGVRYLLRDRRNGHAHAQLASLGRLVYENPSVAIYAVDQQ